MAAPTAGPTSSIMGRARRASVSVMNVNPQLGMWQAAGTAIAHAPNLAELRDVERGGDNIIINSRGHSARLASVHETTGDIALVKVNTAASKSNKTATVGSSIGTKTTESLPSEATRPIDVTEKADKEHHHRNREHQAKAKWGQTVKHGLNAFWKFFLTPAGFLMTIYFLNIVVS